MLKNNPTPFSKLPKEILQQMTQLELEIYKQIADCRNTSKTKEELQFLSDNLLQFNALAVQLLQFPKERGEKQLKKVMENVLALNSHFLILSSQEETFLNENLKLLGKLWVGADEFIKKPGMKCKLALMVTLHLGKLLDVYERKKEINKAFYTATQLLLWRDRIGEVSDLPHTFTDELYQGNVQFTTKQDKFNLLSDAYITYIRYDAEHRQYGRVVQLLTTLADNNEFIDKKLVNQMIQIMVNVPEQDIFVVKEIGQLLLKYLSKQHIWPLSPAGLAYISSTKESIQQCINGFLRCIANDFAYDFKNTHFKSLNVKYHEKEKCLQLKWNMNQIPYTVIEAKFNKLKPCPVVKYRAGRDLLVYKLEDVDPRAIFNILRQIDELIDRQPIQSALDDCIKQLRRIRFDLPAPAMPSLIPANPMVNPMDMLNTSKKTGAKIKKIAIVKEKKEEITALPKQRMTAHELGFKLNEPNIPVYPISAGDHIPPGIYYSYGIRLDKGQREVSEADLKEYQQILEEGQIVTRGRRGLRLVRPKESGIDERVLFKVTHPRRDLRILMLPEETITDEYGQKKYLYRAGVPKFH